MIICWTDQITIFYIMNQKQTDSRRSSKEIIKSNKLLSRIKGHIKTEKISNLQPNLIAADKKQRSLEKSNMSNEKEYPLLKRSLKSIRQISTSKFLKNGGDLKWKISKTNETLLKKSALPEINEFRGRSQWSNVASIKRPTPSKSMKIPFRELIPIKEITKQQKIQNLCRIRDQFRELVNTSNNIFVRNSQSVFRAYVEKGNNGVLVKQLIKKRWWWHIVDKPQKANLLWTEWFNKSHTKNMPQIEASSYKQCESDYSYREAMNEPRIQSIRKILDQPTFSRIRPRISLREEHYLRGHKSINIQEKPFDQAKIKEVQALNDSIHNHIDGCLQLHSKKLLFKNFYSFLKQQKNQLFSKGWEPFDFIPVTYYIDSKESPVINTIAQHYGKIHQEQLAMSRHNLWIVKPGENSNRGFGITVHSDLNQILAEIEKRMSNHDSGRSLIIQKYIQNSFLVYNRKFDIRCYILITTVNGNLKGYWYNDGYIRTSSEQYNLNDVSNKMIHLTNDAVQKHNQSYGKYEDFNKMSFNSFRKYITKMGHAQDSFQKAYERMKQIAYYLIASVGLKIRRKQYTFQLFGLDFMLDDELCPFLIQANSNPCLETSGVILGKLIPQLIDNVIMTAIDPLFPSPNKTKSKDYLSKDYFRSNKFQLIFSDNKAEDSKAQNP